LPAWKPGKSTCIRDDGDFEIFDVPVTGIRPFVLFNVSKSPFDDLRVRQAFSYAVDRESLITVVLLGNGKPLYGTLNEGTIGYDPGLEEQGIHHDLNKAKALMQEAGYTYDENGMLLTPEGELFVLDYPILQMFNYPKVAEVLVEQYKALGVTLNIMLEEVGIGWQRLVEGDYEIAVGGLGYTDADVLYFGWHSSSIGAINLSRVNDPVMDEILERTRSEIDPTARQVAVTEAQLDMMEQAYIVPLFNSYYHYAVNRRVQGIIPSPNITYFWFQDAFIVED
jgi:peptide/nickel transport system substrate-binding protein